MALPTDDCHACKAMRIELKKCPLCKELKDDHKQVWFWRSLTKDVDNE